MHLISGKLNVDSKLINLIDSSLAYGCFTDNQ